MKQRKTYAMCIVFVLASSAVSADINFSAWGRGVVTPLAWTTDSSGTHSAVSAATFTSSDKPNIGFTANGSSASGKIGFKIDLAYGNGEAGIGDNAKVWVRPVAMFTLTSGFFKEEELRGKIGASEFASWILPNSGKNEDNIFQRFDAFAGAHFKLDPILWLDTPWNGLTIQGAFGSNAPGAPGNNTRAILNLFNNEDNNTLGYTYDESDDQYNGDRKMNALDVFKAMQIALGYTIPEIGLFRVQFIGNNRNVFRWTSEEAGFPNRETRLVTGMNTNRDADIIEAAFCYKYRDNLVVDIGAKLPLEYTTQDTTLVLYPQVVNTSGGVIHAEINNGNGDDVTIQQPLVIAAGVSWKPDFLPDLKIMARADIFFGEKITITSALDNSDSVRITKGFGINAWLMPSYRVWNDITIGLDIGIENHGRDSVWMNGIGNAPKSQTKASEYFDFGAGLWGEMALGEGRLRLGFVMMSPGTVRYRNNQNHELIKYSPQFRAKPVFSIPISFTYSL
jgi:hypothetical protein